MTANIAVMWFGWGGGGGWSHIGCLYKRQCSFQKEIVLNPFIYIARSKPLISSGYCLTLHNCRIYYLPEVNYDPAITDLIFMVQYLPRASGWGLSTFLNPLTLAGSLLTLQPYPTILAMVTIYPARFTALFRLVSRQFFTLFPWAFALI